MPRRRLSARLIEAAHPMGLVRGHVIWKRDNRKAGPINRVLHAGKTSPSWQPWGTCVERIYGVLSLALALHGFPFDAGFFLAEAAGRAPAFSLGRLRRLAFNSQFRA